MMKNKLYESMEIDFENGCGIVESLKINKVNERDWKSYGWKGYKKVWEYVLGKVNKIDKGWVLVESGSNRGDGSVYGMSKEYRNLGLNKK